MKRYLRILTLLLAFFSVIGSTNKLFATHLAGGEITWKCVTEGGVSKYVFRLTLYRNCATETGGTAAGLSTTFESLNCNNLSADLDPVRNGTRISDGSTIVLRFIENKDISPACNFPIGTFPLNCATPDIGALEKFSYESDPIDFFGINPPTDANSPLIFSWSTCCRNGGIVNVQNSGGKSMVLVTKMYPFFPNGQTSANPIDQCFDNSPFFTEAPAAILYTSGLDFVFNSNATDPDLDNLIYGTADPLVEEECVNAPCNPEEVFVNWPYFNNSNPMGLLPSQYNLNVFTGEYTFKPLVSGNYVTVFKVAAYKCDQKVAEIFRDFQSRILVPDSSQNSNRYPTFFPPFKDANQVPTSQLNVIAGNTLWIPIVVRDSLADGSTISPQSLELTVNGIGMGLQNADTLLGCPYPPCAMLTKNKNDLDYVLPGNAQPIPIQNIPGEVFGYGYDLGTSYGTLNDTVWVYWPTSCSNLDKTDDCNGLTSSRYNFVVTAKDNFCRVPGKTIRTFSVNVLAPDFYLSPPIRSITYDQVSRQVSMYWGPSTGDTNTFVRYEIYRENTLLYSTTNRNTFFYNDFSTGASPDSSYYVRSVNLCGVLDDVSPAKPIQLEATFVRGTQAKITYNPLRGNPTPILPTAVGFTVQRSQTSAPYTWVTINDGDGDTTNFEAIDNFDLCSDTTYYRVTHWDSLGTTSYSTIDTIFHPTIRAVIRKDTVCNLSQSTFILDTLYGGIPPYTTVRWLGEEGFGGGNEDTIRYVFPTYGQKKFTFTVIDSKGCRIDIEDSTYVRQLPEFTVVGDSSCPLSVITLGVDVTSMPGIQTISWTGDNGFWNTSGPFSNPQFSSPKWIFSSDNGQGPGVGKFPIVVVLTDSFGCATTLNDTIETGAPYAEIQADTAVCYSKEDSIAYRSFFLTRPFNSVQWVDGATGTVVYNQGDKLPVSVLAGRRYINLIIRIEDAVGCAGYDTIDLKLSPAFDYSADSLCINEPVNFQLDFANGSDTLNFSYLWELDANTISTDRFPIHTYASSGSKIITLLVTDNVNGCTTFFSDTITVRDPMNFTIGVNPDCAGLPTQFAPNVISGIDTAWQWTINEEPDVIPGNTITSTLREPLLLIPAGDGNYRITLRMNDASTGCWTEKDTIMKVFNQPDVDFAVDSLNCSGEITQFISRVIGDSGPYIYQWTGEDNFTSNEQNPTHIYPNGIQEYYTVSLQVTNRFNCVVTRTKQVRVCDDDRTLVLVPEIFSPGSENNNTLSVSYTNVDNFKFQVYNRWGIEVFSSTDPDFVWDGKDEKGELLQSGTYVFIVNANGSGKRNYLNKGTIVVLR
jgi:hypothetical protein